jgi:hypothetical protein
MNSCVKNLVEYGEASQAKINYFINRFQVEQCYQDQFVDTVKRIVEQLPITFLEISADMLAYHLVNNGWKDYYGIVEKVKCDKCRGYGKTPLPQFKFEYCDKCGGTGELIVNYVPGSNCERKMR